MLRHLAKNLRDDVDFVKRYASEGEENKVKKPLRLPSLFDRPSVHLAKLSFVASIAYYASRFTGGAVHYLVMCLLLGTLFYALGFLEKGILQKHSQAASSFFRYHRDLFFFEPDNPAGSALRPSAACSYGLIGYIGAFTAGLVTNRLFSCLFPLRESWRDLHLWFSYNDACLSGSIRCHGKK